MTSQYIISTNVFFFFFFFAGVPFLITAELFKQSHRPAAYTVGGSLNWMSNFTIGFIFPFLQVSNPFNAVKAKGTQSIIGKGFFPGLWSPKHLSESIIVKFNHLHLIKLF